SSPSVLGVPVITAPCSVHRFNVVVSMAGTGLSPLPSPCNPALALVDSVAREPSGVRSAIDDGPRRHEAGGLRDDVERSERRRRANGTDPGDPGHRPAWTGHPRGLRIIPPDGGWPRRPLRSLIVDGRGGRFKTSVRRRPVRLRMSITGSI